MRSLFPSVCRRGFVRPTVTQSLSGCRQISSCRCDGTYMKNSHFNTGTLSQIPIRCWASHGNETAVAVWGLQPSDYQKLEDTSWNVPGRICFHRFHPRNWKQHCNIVTLTTLTWFGSRPCCNHWGLDRHWIRLQPLQLGIWQAAAAVLFSCAAPLKITVVLICNHDFKYSRMWTGSMNHDHNQNK